MLVPRRLRLLTLDPSGHPRRQPHLSAASGIARAGRFAYIVGDDEHHLARLDAADLSSPIELARFTPGLLPQESAGRKKEKPDIEVLIHLPGVVPGEPGRLALLGSGARPQRERVFAIELQADGGMRAAAVELPAATFYAPIRALFEEPNLEAGYVDGVHVHLFQRAHRGQALNARITYDAAELCAWLRGRAATAPQPVAVHRFSLGSHEGVPFGITDAAAWSRPGCVFTAVAEDTSDAYRDGACVAAMVGCMDADGHVGACELLAGAPKVEGITPANDGRLWMVTDADDPHRPSELLEVEWAPD
jgi:hypothetical protein